VDASAVVNDTIGPESVATSDVTEDNDIVVLNDCQNQVQLPSLLRRRFPGDENDAEDAEKTQELVFFDEISQKSTQLPRIPTCAIFHRLTSGPGVPHTFYGFIRQMPALPRVVIFLSVHMLPIAYVPAEDAFSVTKVRSIKGFYGATYRIGFRDDFNPSTEHILRIIHDIEARADPSQSRRILDEIKEATDRIVHLIPHYHVVSEDVHFSPRWAAVALSWIRRLFIEAIYRRLSTMFPETANWALDNDDILYVGLNAPI